MPQLASEKLPKLIRERNSPLRPREQGRNLWEAVNQARRLIELADHKARYALVVMGVVNAGVFILATRSDHFAQMVPVGIRPWFSFLVFPFGIMALIFLVDAYNTLRPRPPSLPRDGADPIDVERHPVGLIFWDSLLTHSVEHYQRAWETVHHGQLNNELAAMAYSLAAGIQSKYRALRRLYVELLIIILLAGVMLAVPMFYGFLSNGPGVIPVP
jgi:hypothetical protein